MGKKTKIGKYISGATDPTLKTGVNEGLSNPTVKDGADPIAFSQGVDGTKEPETNSPYTWKDYANLISAKTTNSKAALDSAYQRATMNTQNYLKSLGLQGSGAGLGVAADMGTNYANANAALNENARNEVDSELGNTYMNRVKAGASDEELQSFRDYYSNYLNTDSLKAEGDSYLADKAASEAETEAENNKQVVSNTLESMMLNPTTTESEIVDYINSNVPENEKQYWMNQLDINGKSSRAEINMINEDVTSLINGGTLSSNEIRYLSEVSNSLSSNDPDTVARAKEDISYFMNNGVKRYSGDITEKNKSYIMNETNIDSYSTDDEISAKDAKSEDFKFSGRKNSNTKQYKYASAVIKAAREGKIPDGTVINMNYGYSKNSNNDYYVYTNGKFVKIKSGYVNDYNTINYNNINNALGINW